LKSFIPYIILSLLLISNSILPQSYFYSFENTHSGWDTTGIDLQLGDTTIAWSIHPSNEIAIDSSFSMQYYLENYNDAGKIWIQMPYSVEQNKDYIVTINYKFASRDFGLANLWTIITGVHLSPPTNAQELTYQGHTGNGFDFDTGYVWLDKNYEFSINSNSSNKLWTVIGIWGNWETPRIYYLDSLSIYIQEENPSGILDDERIINDYFLYQNYPNPFNPNTTIKYQVQELSFVTLMVYDVLGNEITTLVIKEKPTGIYEIEYDASDLTSGYYFYRLQAGQFIDTKKMVLMK
jgi:hypothetical protein